MYNFNVHIIQCDSSAHVIQVVMCMPRVQTENLHIIFKQNLTVIYHIVTEVTLSMIDHQLFECRTSHLYRFPI